MTWWRSSPTLVEKGFAISALILVLCLGVCLCYARERMSMSSESDVTDTFKGASDCFVDEEREG